MKVFVVFATLLLAANAADEYCFKNVEEACRPTDAKNAPTNLPKCTAVYGGIEDAKSELQEYIDTHIMRSFDYLLLSTHFGNYQKNRAGFEKLFRGLSDSTWEQSIELIKYVSKRGTTPNFMKFKRGAINFGSNSTYELYELEALAKALSIQKELAENAFAIHKKASHRAGTAHDPEITSYIEEHFTHKHAETIRQLSGHVADLRKMINEADHPLSMFLFDEYLQKL